MMERSKEDSMITNDCKLLIAWLQGDPDARDQLFPISASGRKEMREIYAKVSTVKELIPFVQRLDEINEAENREFKAFWNGDRGRKIVASQEDSEVLNLFFFPVASSLRKEEDEIFNRIMKGEETPELVNRLKEISATKSRELETLVER